MKIEAVENELKRLAPQVTDSDALAATRARVMSVVHDQAAAHDEAVDPGGRNVVLITRARPRRRFSRRIGAAAAVAAVGIVGATVWPDPDPNWIPAAYASWRAVPEPVTPGNAEVQAKECLARVRVGDPDGVVADALRSDDLVPVVAERRGDWTYTLLTVEDGGDHAHVTCLLPLDPNSHEGGTLGGSSGGTAPTLASDEIRWSGGGWDGNWSDTWGYAGDEVDRVTVTLSNGVVVDATVASGYFAAWWPSVSTNGQEGEAAYALTWYLKGGSVGGTYELAADWPKSPQAG